MAIMLTAFTKLMSTTFKGMRTVTQSTDLTTEAQLSTPIMIERIQKAYCFFPPGETITFGNSPLHQNTIRPNTDTTTRNWTIGNDPVLAMFMPNSTTTSNTDTYDFYAYYPIKRSSYMKTNQIGPSPDVQNDTSVWMILEYKHSITLSSTPSCDGSENLTGGKRPRYVADYVAPSNQSGPYDIFSYDIPPADAADQRRSIEVKLRFQRHNGKRIEQLPVDGSEISTKIYPRNISYW